MTVNETMELVEEYARDIEDIAYSEAVFAHVDKRRYAGRDKSFAELRTAIEELAADASRYRWLRADYHSKVFIETKGCGFEWPEYSHDQLDTAIDAAMKGST